jgi:D-alanyl-D-alanine carboxypeptidase
VHLINRQVPSKACLPVSRDGELHNSGVNIPDSNKITIRQLLNHTSGLVEFDEDEKFFNTYINNLARKWTSKELLEISLSYPRYGAPGGEAPLLQHQLCVVGLDYRAVHRK